MGMDIHFQGGAILSQLLWSIQNGLGGLKQEVKQKLCASVIKIAT